MIFNVNVLFFFVFFNKVLLKKTGSFSIISALCLISKFGTNLRHFIRVHFVHLSWNVWKKSTTQSHTQEIQSMVKLQLKTPGGPGRRVVWATRRTRHQAHIQSFTQTITCLHLQSGASLHQWARWGAAPGKPTPALFSAATCHLNAALTLSDVFSAAAVTSPPSLLSFPSIAGNTCHSRTCGERIKWLPGDDSVSKQCQQLN